jgi:hypothetical protein
LLAWQIVLVNTTSGASGPVYDITKIICELGCREGLIYLFQPAKLLDEKAVPINQILSKSFELAEALYYQ